MIILTQFFRQFEMHMHLHDHLKNEIADNEFLHWYTAGVWQTWKICIDIMREVWSSSAQVVNYLFGTLTIANNCHLDP